MNPTISKITDVTLFEDRARICRTLTPAKTGRQKIRLEGLSPWLLDKSVQLKAPGLKVFEMRLQRRTRQP